MAGDKKVLDSEFNRLVEFVEKTIVKESTVAKANENKPHNRYVDIGKITTREHLVSGQRTCHPQQILYYFNMGLNASSISRTPFQTHL